MKRLQTATAIFCVWILLPLSGLAQMPAPFHGAPLSPAGGLYQPYRWRQEPPVNLSNSSRLESLIRAGRLYLSLQDAIALALENNLDIELQRYNLRNADAALLKAEAGGAGVPVYDPVASFNYNFAHQTTPQTSSFVTGTNSLVNRVKTANFSIQKGFITGTTATFGWNNTFARSNSGRSDFNPSMSSNFSLQITQPLLRGFGWAVNNRNIRVAKNNRQVSDLAFREQVINTVANIVNLYWDLVSYNEDVKVKRQALALAEKLRSDNQKQVEIGTLAPIEVVRAEAQVALSQQDLTISETRLLQQETLLKNALSRTGVASPLLAEARIVPTDLIRVPAVEPVQPIQDLIAQALSSRPDLDQSRVQIENSKISLEGVKSSLKPSLDLVGSLQNNGLAGQINSLPIPPIPGTNLPPSQRNPNSVDPFFLGGYGTVLSQLFARNFPNYGIGFQLNIPLRNRSAQADMIQNQLALRQQEIRQQQLINQIRLDVTNALIALQQARATYEAAVKTRILQEQTLDAEEKKYALGASTIFFVIQAQRDLAQARSSEVAALSNYSKARVALDRATGQVLAAYGVEIEEAKSGKVARGPSPLPPPEQN